MEMNVFRKLEQQLLGFTFKNWIDEENNTKDNRKKQNRSITNFSHLLTAYSIFPMSANRFLCTGLNGTKIQYRLSIHSKKEVEYDKKQIQNETNLLSVRMQALNTIGIM